LMNNFLRLFPAVNALMETCTVPCPNSAGIEIGSFA
jgi:hypothetical protein